MLIFLQFIFYSFQNFFDVPIGLIKKKPPWGSDPLLPFSPRVYVPANPHALELTRSLNHHDLNFRLNTAAGTQNDPLNISDTVPNEMLKL